MKNKLQIVALVCLMILILTGCSPVEETDMAESDSGIGSFIFWAIIIAIFCVLASGASSNADHTSQMNAYVRGEAGPPKGYEHLEDRPRRDKPRKDRWLEAMQKNLEEAEGKLQNSSASGDELEALEKEVKRCRKDVADAKQMAADDKQQDAYAKRLTKTTQHIYDEWLGDYIAHGGRATENKKTHKFNRFRITPNIPILPLCGAMSVIYICPKGQSFSIAEPSGMNKGLGHSTLVYWDEEGKPQSYTDEVIQYI